MTVQAAIEILKKQTDKLPVDTLNQQNWINETAHYLTLFLGPNHDQTRRVKSFTFKQSSKRQNNEFWGYRENPNYDPTDKQDIAKSIIDSCIDILKTTNKLYKEPKTNFLSTLGQEKLIGWLSIILSIVLALIGYAYYTGKSESDNKIERLEYEKQKLNDSLTILRSSFKNDTETKSQNDTTKTKNQQLY